MTQVLVYWVGIIGVPGKGPNWTEQYDPNRTIGDLVDAMQAHGLGGSNKRIKILKHFSLHKLDQSDPYWSHSTKLSECGGLCGKYLTLAYCIV